MKKKYIRPFAIDLSGLGVVGYEPLGSCADGSFPTSSNCEPGTTITQYPNCQPTGNSPEIGGCAPTGGNVTSDCTSGTTIAWGQ